MKHLFYSIILMMCLVHQAQSQSLELMAGPERIFADAQWLKTFDKKNQWSLFSRTRATVDYEDNTNLFSGAYLNYTTKAGIGGTVLGRISSTGAGSDVGVHFFKLKKSFMIYALPSIQLNSELGYSWFSIARFTPELSEKWKLYSSLELFSSFNKEGHAASVQRIRLGLDRNKYQFGFAINLLGIQQNYSGDDTNVGAFLRKEF